jgi:two-component system phosphate regulon response regulator PhoB
MDLRRPAAPHAKTPSRLTEDSAVTGERFRYGESQREEPRVRTVLTTSTAAGQPTGSQPAAAGPGLQPVRTGRHGPVVLVAGGNHRQRGRLSRRLRRSGFYVQLVPDGPTALAAANRCPPAAVVMEWLMPGNGGTDICARMREHPTLRRVPVVLLAARGDGAQIAEGFRAGADEVLTRPLDTTELVGFLERNMAWAANGRGRV